MIYSILRRALPGLLIFSGLSLRFAPGQDAVASASRPSSSPVAESAPVPGEHDTASMPASQPSAWFRSIDAPENRDPRMAALNRKHAEFLAMKAWLAAGNLIENGQLELEFEMPPFGAHSKTLELREEVTKLEKEWIETKEQTRIAVELIKKNAVSAEAAQLPPGNSGPTPHALHEAMPIQLAVVQIRMRKFDAVLEGLREVPGANARFIEALAYEGLDQVEDAMNAYQRAASEIGNDARFLASVMRAKKSLEWRIQFGRPENLTAALRNTPLSERIQSAISPVSAPPTEPSNTTEHPGADPKGVVK